MSRPATTLMMGALLSLLSTAVAAAWQLEPELRISEQWQDNVGLVAESDQPVSAASVGAVVGVGLRQQQPRSSLQLLGRLDGNHYLRADEALHDSVNQLWRFDGRYRSRPQQQWRLQADLRRDTLWRTLADAEDSELLGSRLAADTDPYLVSRSIRRDRLLLAPAIEFALSERSELIIELRHLQVRYDALDSDLSEYREAQLSGQWRYHLNERDWLNTTLRTIRYRNRQSDLEVVSEEALLGFGSHLSPTTDIGFEVGVQRSRFLEPDAAEDQESGALLTLDTDHRSDRGRYRVSLVRTLLPSGAGERLINHELQLQLEPNWGELTQVALQGRLFRTEALRAAGRDAERRYLELEPAISHRLSRWWQLRLSYRYQQQRDIAASSTAEGNQIRLSATYRRQRPLP